MSNGADALEQISELRREVEILNGAFNSQADAAEGKLEAVIDLKVSELVEKVEELETKLVQLSEKFQIVLNSLGS